MHYSANWLKFIERGREHESMIARTNIVIDQIRSDFPRSGVYWRETVELGPYVLEPMTNIEADYWLWAWVEGDGPYLLEINSSCFDGNRIVIRGPSSSATPTLFFGNDVEIVPVISLKHPQYVGQDSAFLESMYLNTITQGQCCSHDLARKTSDLGEERKLTCKISR